MKFSIIGRQGHLEMNIDELTLPEYEDNCLLRKGIMIEILKRNVSINGVAYKGLEENFYISEICTLSCGEEIWNVNYKKVSDENEV